VIKYLIHGALLVTKIPKVKDVPHKSHGKVGTPWIVSMLLSQTPVSDYFSLNRVYNW